MQAEAGQGLEKIILRKERERSAGSGHFFWGVGNAPSVLINSLARTGEPTPVVFSKMKSRPKPIDQNPTSTVIWRQYVNFEGKVCPLPPNALVTSRGETELRKKKAHYALECFSRNTLSFEQNTERFKSTSYRNASGKGARVGASQVTALLTPSNDEKDGEASDYRVDMRAELTGSYWVKLVDPLPLSKAAVQVIDHSDDYSGDWISLITELRGRPDDKLTDSSHPLLL